MNGDGLTDILEKALVHPNQNIGHDRIYYRIHTAQRNSDGSIGFQVNEVTQLSGDFSFGEDFYQSYYMSTAADVDGDGIGELLVTERVRGPEANNVQFLFFGDNSFKTGFKYVKETEDSDVYGLGDLNNDGKSDIVIIEKSPSSGYYAGAVMGIKTANTDAFRRPFHFTLPCDPENVYVADINIDGMADIVVIHGNGYTIFWNDGTWLDSYTSLCTPSPTTGTFSNLHPAQAFPGDFNGDGITDFLVTVTDDDTWYLELGRGDGSFSHMTACTIYAYDQSSSLEDDDLLSCYIYDMDGDGKSDVFISKGMYYPYIPGPFKKTHTYWLRSTGESLQQIKTSTSVRKLDSSPRYYLIGDFNGDGYSELANNGYDCYNGNDANVDPTWHVYPNTAFNAAVGKVSSVTNGFGATTSISYKSMTDNTVYTRGTQTEPTGSAIINCPPVLHVVSSTTSDDGAAGQQTVNYQYGGLKAHVRGKGLLGMSYTKVSNVTQGTATESVISGWNTESLQPVRRTARQYKGTDMSQAVTHYVSSKPYSQKAWFTRPDSLIQTDMDGNVSGVLPDYDPQHGYLRQKIEYWDDAHFEHNYSGYSCYGGVWLPGSIEDVRYSLTSDELTTVTHLEYNAYGLKTLETVNYNSSKPLTHAYTYDACGNLYTETVSGSGVTANTKTYGYDDTKRFVTSVTESSGNQSLVSSFTYDTWGHLLTETSRTTGNNPLTTTHIYDGWGNRTRTELPSGQVRAFSQGWGSTASQCYFTLEQGTATPWVKTWYDRSGRKMSEESRTVMDGPFVSIWTYDNRGRLTTTSTVTEALSMGEQTTYDGRDRLLTRVSTTGSSQGYTYGNRTVTVTDGANRSYTKTYDPRGNLLSSSDPSGTVSYVNDADGKPLSITAHGTTVTVSYDDRGNRYQLCDPDAGTMTYVYDALGRVISQTDARSNQTTFTYDGFGNLTATAINGQPHTSHTYSYTGATAGLLMSESAGGATVSYTYDAYDRLATKSYSLPQTVMAQAQQYSYTYGTNGLVQSITYPGSLTVGYNYDCYGNKIRTTSAGTTVWEMEWYDGQITVVNHTNSIQSCKGLDSRGHLQQLYMLKDHGGDYGIDFVYDGATGNLIERWNSEQAQQELFTYDALDRLTGAGGQTYSYAGNGNLTYKTGIGHYTYDSSKPHAVTSIENTARLMDMSRLDTEYNGFGKIERIRNDETNRSLDFLYGPDEERYCSIQRDSAGSVERETVYLDGLDIVVDGQGNKEWFYYVDDHVITKKTGSGTFSHYFTFTDQVGSILKVVDANETERFSATYDPWGRQTVTLNEIGLIRGFTGHEMLTEYGLINMNGRLYDPLLGRFLSTDNFVQEPGSTQSFNRYSYCLNNPLKYNDPSGEIFGLDDLIVIGGIVIGAYLGGTSANNGELNPFHWNYGSIDTYLGIGVGAILGGTAAYGIVHPGSINFMFGISSRWGNIGFSASAATAGLGYGTDWKWNLHWTTAAGGEGSTDYSPSKLDEKVGQIYDDAVESMRDCYAAGIKAYNYASQYFQPDYIHSTLDATGVFFDAADAANAILYGIEGDYANAGISAAAMVPVAGNFVTAGKYANKGFKTFKKFKKEYGTAGDGMNWHHIVEQTPSNIQGFGPEMIHNTNNLIRIPGGKGSIHARISGHYSSKPEGLNGLTVRQWLSTQSYEKQYEYGLDILRKYGWK